MEYPVEDQVSPHVLNQCSINCASKYGNKRSPKFILQYENKIEAIYCGETRGHHKWNTNEETRGHLRSSINGLIILLIYINQGSLLVKYS